MGWLLTRAAAVRIPATASIDTTRTASHTYSSLRTAWSNAGQTHPGQATVEQRSSNGRTTVEQRSSNGRATVEQRSSNGRATVEQRSETGQRTVEQSKTGQTTVEHASDPGQTKAGRAAHTGRLRKGAGGEERGRAAALLHLGRGGCGGGEQALADVLSRGRVRRLRPAGPAQLRRQRRHLPPADRYSTVIRPFFDRFRHS